jgi:glycosyltransferase involved in cell wall biosynthesis
MIRIAHIRDEAEIGGVGRMLEYQAAHLGAGFTQQTVIASPQRLTPLAIDADVIVVHVTSIWSKVPYLAALRAMRPGRPLILVEHSYTEQFVHSNIEGTRHFTFMLRRAYSLATHVVAVSHGQAAWMRAQCLVPETKLTVIRSATDMSSLMRLVPPAERKKDGPLHLGAYGRYAEQKGFDVLVEAMHHVPHEVARLSLRGIGPDKDKLTTLALGLPHVIVGGLVHDVASFLETVDAVAVPSRWEAFGQVAAEARAAARPLITADVDGLTEQVAPDFGQLVPAGDAKALARAICDLARCHLSDMGAAARRSVVNHGADHLAGWRTLHLTAVRKPVALVSQSSAT